MPRRAKRGKDDDAMSQIQCYYLHNLFLHDPSAASKPYVLVSILDPITTIERHHGKYHIAARFNIETTILNYESRTRDGHEYFFQDICLQFLSPWANEDLSMKPESDPSAALTVTRGTETSLSGTAGLTLSQTPSANVSLGLNRNKTLTVEYALTTWSLSAHRVDNVSRPKTVSSPHSKNLSTVGHTTDIKAGERPVYQWFWGGTHGDTKTLTPDLKYTVKRHVVVKRAIPVAHVHKPKKNADNDEPVIVKLDKENMGGDDITSTDKTSRKAKEDETVKLRADGKEEPYNLGSLLDFSFLIQVRVKKRYGRFHRVLLFSGNEVKGKLLKPTFEQSFRLHAKPVWEGVPENDTLDINAMLGNIKQEYAQNYDSLEDKDFFELSNAYIVTQQRTTVHTRERDFNRPVEYSVRTAG